MKASADMVSQCNIPLNKYCPNLMQGEELVNWLPSSCVDSLADLVGSIHQRPAQSSSKHTLQLKPPGNSGKRHFKQDCRHSKSAAVTADNLKHLTTTAGKVYTADGCYRITMQIGSHSPTQQAIPAQSTNNALLDISITDR